MAYVTTRTVPRGERLDLYRGDTWSITFERLGDISGRDNLWFTLKNDFDDSDASAWAQIDEDNGLLYIDGAAASAAANGSITVTDATAGNLTVALQAEESAKLDDVGALHYDVQEIEGTTVTTLVRGSARVLADATKAVS
jgi:hypothetical protein